ncbi:MAG: hypothetical protein HC837_14925 [Chloroflexaceae bacterium]|nr:hypothetical protein [Chloroflexaceae bacterium]
MDRQRFSVWYRALLLVGVIVFVLSVGMYPNSMHVHAQDKGTDLAQDTPVALAETYPFYQNTAIALAYGYLQSQQQDDGGIDAFGFGSNPGGTARVIYALNAVGYPTNTMQTADGTTLLDFLTTQAVSYTYANGIPADENLFPGAAGLVLAAVAAADEDPTNFAGVNLIEALNSTLKPTGAYSTTAEAGFSSGAANAINQSLAIFGLVAAGQPIPTSATDWLIDQQETAGSWSGGSIDVTGYCIMALIGSGNVPPTNAAIQQARVFLRSQQTSSSALWNDTTEFGEPANSTGWSMTALATAGYMPVTESWASGGTNPQQALIALQDPEGVIGKNFANAYSTLEALYGLTAQPLYMAPPARVARALSWIAAQQNADGGWPSFGTDSDPGSTLDIVLAFASAGYDPASVTNGGNTPVDYLQTIASTYTRDDNDIIFPSQTGKLIVGIVASGGDPTNYAPDNLNLVTDVQSTLQDTGAYSTTALRGFATGAASPFNQSLVILGLVAAGEAVPQSAIDWLIGEQQADGSWGSVDNTGLALQALRAADIAVDDQVMVAALTFLRDSQADIGGWDGSGATDASAISTNSTAYAIQGLLAAGVDLNDTQWLTDGRSPLGVLSSHQKPDGPFVFNWTGSFGPGSDNLFATQQVIPALVNAFYPYTNIDSANLEDFTAITLEADPDRMVAVAPVASFSADRTSLNVVVPFGSDLNGDGTMTLEWRIADGSFTPVSATRQLAFYEATIDLAGTDVTPLDTLEFQATFTDNDGVQNGTSQSNQEIVTIQLSPSRVYLPLVTYGSTTTGTTDQNQAALAVRFSDGTVETECITFSEDEISGADLLERSTLTVETLDSDSFGTAICKIGNEGCSADTCFCDPDSFWKYFLRTESAWESSPVGASSRMLTNGDLDGWAWGSSDDSQAQPPADLTFNDICSAA